MGVTETFKTLWEIARQYDNAELNQQILELQGEVGDLQQAKHKLKGRCRDLEAQVEDLENRLAFSEDLTLEQGVYWARGGDSPDSPFCTRCWDVEKRAVRLIEREGFFHHCPQCETSYKVQ